MERGVEGSGTRPHQVQDLSALPDVEQDKAVPDSFAGYEYQLDELKRQKAWVHDYVLEHLDNAYQIPARAWYNRL